MIRIQNIIAMGINERYGGNFSATEIPLRNNFFFKFNRKVHKANATRTSNKLKTEQKKKQKQKTQTETNQRNEQKWYKNESSTVVCVV